MKKLSEPGLPALISRPLTSDAAPCSHPAFSLTARIQRDELADAGMGD